MSEPFLGEIRIFGTDFAPSGWALCNGQLMPLQQNMALFSLLGVGYGGDGRTTFALPNLQGASPMQQGTGPGLSARTLGQTGGTPSVTLQGSEIAAHTHQLMHTGGAANASMPGPDLGFGRTMAAQVYAPGSSATPAVPQALGPSGGGNPHNNRQPYLALNFCIALQGIYPMRP